MLYFVNAYRHFYSSGVFFTVLTSGIDVDVFTDRKANKSFNCKSIYICTE